MQVGSVQNPVPSSAGQPAKGTAKASTPTYTDPRDTNGDGVVSAAEALAYSRTQPSLEEVTPAINTPSRSNGLMMPLDYTQQGLLNQASPTSGGRVDLVG